MEKIPQENTRTLLGRFVQEKTQQYIEPLREGTPRGEPIGLSAVKYGASLYGLTNIKQKEIAERLDISHGLLRKWHTEEPFKAMIDKHCREFAEVFIRNMRDRIKLREALNKNFLAQPLQEIASQEFSSLGYYEISDAGDYSDLADLNISNSLEIEVNKAIAVNDISLLIEIFAMIDALRFFRGENESGKSAENRKQIMNRFLKVFIRKSIEILLKPNIDENDKKDLLLTLKLMAGEIE